jgi:hypothetical protein
MSCNTFDAPSSKYSDKNLTVENLVANTLTFDEIINRQNDPALKYDQTTLLANINKTIEIVTLIKNTASLADAYSYPLLTSRLEQGSITTTEFGDFLSQTAYDIEDVQIAVSIVDTEEGTTEVVENGTFVYTEGIAKVIENGTLPTETEQYLDQLEFYYNGNLNASITGGFCALFTGALSKLKSLLSTGAALLDSLKNIPNILDKLKLLSIKEIMNSLVDKLKDKFKKIVSNVTKQIGKVKGGLKTLGKKIKQVTELFSEDNIAKIKGKIEETLAKLAGSFEELTLDKIQYMLFQFCRMTEAISAFMTNPVDSLKSAFSNFTNAKEMIVSISNKNTIDAVVAGAVRIEATKIIDAQTQVTKVINHGATTSIEPGVWISSPITPEEEALAQSILTAQPAEILSGSFDAAKYLQFTPNAANAGNIPVEGAGYKNVNPVVYAYAIRLAKILGKKFIIISAYRSEAYNSTLKGSAKKSQHMNGFALDILRSSMGDPEKFIVAASREGFTGIGTYNSFIHIDRRSNGRNYWSSASGANRHEDLLQKHMAGSFVTAKPVPPTPIASYDRNV